MLRLKSVCNNLLKSVCLFRGARSLANPTAVGTGASTELGTGLSAHYIWLVLGAALFVLCAIPLSVANAATATIGWEANEEPDLEGYVIYRNTDAAGPPYRYFDELPEDELDDPMHPRVKLTGLQEGKEYYIALTAYNTEGIESSFSNEICAEVVNNTIELCDASASSPVTTSTIDGGSDGGSSSGGGLCFISTSGTEAQLFFQRVAWPMIRSRTLAMHFSAVHLVVAVKLGSNKKETP